MFSAWTVLLFQVESGCCCQKSPQKRAWGVLIGQKGCVKHDGFHSLFLKVRQVQIWSAIVKKVFGSCFIHN